jgi:hypothetical protein
MPRARWSRSGISAGLLLLLTITYSINYDIGFSIRVGDLAALLFISWALFSSRFRVTSTVVFALGFFFVYVLSAIYGILVLGIVHAANLLFIYKYALAFLLLWCICSVRLTDPQVHRLIRSAVFVFILLILWVFVHVWLVTHGLATLSFRPSFPFSNGPVWASDAHLYSAFLSNGLVAFLVFAKARVIRVPFPLLVLTCLLGIAALLLTGSRGGLLTFAGTVGLLATMELARKLSRGRLTVRRATLVTAAVGVAVVAGILAFNAHGVVNQSQEVLRLLDRALNFGFGNDASAQSRLQKNWDAIVLLSHQIPLIGVGMQSVGRSWYDSSIGALLVSSGLVGGVLFLCALTAFLWENLKAARANARFPEFTVLFFVVVNYAAANLITEFFLVTRSLVPFVLWAGLASQLIHRPNLRPTLQ